MTLSVRLPEDSLPEGGASLASSFYPRLLGMWMQRLGMGSWITLEDRS